MPSLLKPNRLIAARSGASRNRRGRGLPGCGRGVTAPTSQKPKPVRRVASGALAFLSKPAATPTGLGRARPATEVASRGEVTGPLPPARPRGQRAEREAVCALGVQAAERREADRFDQGHGIVPRGLCPRTPEVLENQRRRGDPTSPGMGRSDVGGKGMDAGLQVEGVGR